jgi:2-(1,2-epoxy-1,2-dihydrophenyl)acetyl-CoA isomerase
MADTPAVRTHHRGVVALVSIDRPQQRNTLTLDVLNGLDDALIKLARSPETRAVVLTGEGDDFSLGGDHQDFIEVLNRSHEEGRKFCRIRTQLLAKVVLGLYSLPVPVIAAVSGQASGAGMSVALACDLRVMDPRSKFHIAYGSLSASTDGGMSWLLPRLIGEGKAMELLLLQPVLRAAQAYDLGLATEVSDRGDALRRACELAEDIANSASHSIRGAKAMLRRAAVAELERHLVVEHEQFIAGLVTTDFRKAIRTLYQDEASSFAHQETGCA